MADRLADNIIHTYYIDTSHLVGLYVVANTLRTLANTQVVIEQANYSHQENSTETPSNILNTKTSTTEVPTEKTLEEQLKEFGIK